jgi:MFS family permease
LAGPPAGTAGAAVPAGPRSPRKLTVTRVAALRSRELTTRGVQMFHRATTADGADKSGLTALTYAVMANYAVDAVLAVALAGTLFFAAATAESTGRVLLYLVITVAPFAVITPFIGPMLDRLQSGRRLALGLSSFGRALLAILMAFNFSHFNPWVIYPCALGNLVLSKAFGVLKAALTPRVLPEQITLVKTNARLTTFGMIAGGVAGAIAAGLSKIAGSPGALFFMAICAVAGGVLCLRIPAWVESTEGEVPVRQVDAGTKRGFPQIVVATLWANGMIRVETGFLALFIAFVVKSQYPQPAHSAFTQLLLLGVIGAAAGVGGFIGNTMGARLTLSAPETISIFALVSVVVSTLIAVLVPGLATAAIVGFVGSTASSLAKVSLDSVIQNHLPEESRASGFGKSESVLQLGWVFGGVVGLLLGGVWTFGHANVYAIGFGTITLILLVGLTQSWLVRSGRTMLPKLSARAARQFGRSSKTSGGVQNTDRLTRPATIPVAPRGSPAPARRRIRKAGK